MSRGYTLLEAVTALTLLGLIISTAAPALGGLRDRATVNASREALAGLIAEARVLAVARGGATVHVRRAPPAAWVSVADSVVRSLPGGVTDGVTLALSGGRDEIRLRYDALGLGRVASSTIRIRRGGVEGALVVSSYGRVRRR